jgi:hypothetical protein
MLCIRDGTPVLSIEEQQRRLVALLKSLQQKGGGVAEKMRPNFAAVRFLEITTRGGVLIVPEATNTASRRPTAPGETDASRGLPSCAVPESDLIGRALPHPRPPYEIWGGDGRPRSMPIVVEAGMRACR